MWKKFKTYFILKFKFWSEKAVRFTLLCTKRCFFAIQGGEEGGLSYESFLGIIHDSFLVFVGQKKELPILSYLPLLVRPILLVFQLTFWKLPSLPSVPDKGANTLVSCHPSIPNILERFSTYPVFHQTDFHNFSKCAEVFLVSWGLIFDTVCPWPGSCQNFRTYRLKFHAFYVLCLQTRCILWYTC